MILYTRLLNRVGDTKPATPDLPVPLRSLTTLYYSMIYQLESKREHILSGYNSVLWTPFSISVSDDFSSLFFLTSFQPMPAEKNTPRAAEAAVK